MALALGRPVARLLLVPVCLYFVLLRRHERAASRQYLAKALGRQPRAIDVFRHFHCFASVFLDRIYLLAGRLQDFDIRVHGEDTVVAAAREGGGCLLFGAHLGSFEVLRCLGERTGALRVQLAMYEKNARQTMAALSSVADAELPVIGLGGMHSMIRIGDALERGDAVGILADRTFEAKGTLACSFLDDDARFPTGPFRLAAMLERPVFLMIGLYRGGNRYDVHFERLAGPRASLPRGAFVEDTLRRYAARLEHYCRIAPYNWFNFYDYWK
jgi:predicted LPLAT superfamily acyltransferase